MQRSQKSVPVTALKLPNNTTPQAKIDETNIYQPVTYANNKARLFCQFGSKDCGIKDPTYLGFKAEMSCFGAAIYQVLTNGRAPKVKRVVNEQGTTNGIITSIVEKAITLHELCQFIIKLEDYDNDDFLDYGLYFSYSFRKYTEPEELPEKTKKKIEEWALNSKKDIDKFFVKNSRLLNFLDIECKLTKADFEKSIDDTCATMCEKINEFIQTEFESADEILKKTLKHHEFTKKRLDFVAAMKNKIIPEIMHTYAEILATAYLMGDYTIKDHDILVTSKGSFFKIDFERGFFEIFHQMIADLAPKRDGYLDDFKKLQSLCSKDIDEFPHRQHAFFRWPFKEHDKHPKWFSDLLKLPEFKQKSHIVFITWLLLPERILRSWAHMQFETKHVDKVLQHVLKRRDYLRKAMLHSCELADYVAKDADNILTQIKEKFIAHNQRWKKDKYADLQIDLDDVSKEFATFKKTLAVKRENLHPEENYTRTIAAPRLL